MPTRRSAVELEALRKSFIELLDKQEKEQVYQTFIEENTELVPRLFLQNHDINHNLVLRKLSLAKDYTTDFFYISKSSEDWNCVLVEIEKPQSQIFKPGTLDFHEDLYRGLDQIHRWRSWFLNPDNFNGFTRGTIRPLRMAGLLVNNPCHIKYVLVMGRRSEIANNEDRRRRLSVIQTPGEFRIISYDSLAESLNAKQPLYLGVRKNEYYEIRSTKYAGEAPFVYMPPETLRINENLRQDIIKNREEWITHTDYKTKTLDVVLPKLLNY